MNDDPHKNSKSNDPLTDHNPKRKSRAKLYPGWHEFDVAFSLRRPNFFSRITMKHPKLTPQELRVCAMLSDLMPSKEIGIRLAIDERTVENHRTKIRRKLGLSHEQHLENYLIQF
jgi:AraC family transcriptional regulator, chitin signaling transcriptional activator